MENTDVINSQNKKKKIYFYATSNDTWTAAWNKEIKIKLKNLLNYQQ